MTAVKPRPAPASTAPFLIAGLCAAIPLLFLSAAAPGGEAWKWLEYPRPITVIACALALIACSRTRIDRAVWVPLGTVAISCVWELVTSRGMMIELVLVEAITRLAPWLVGGVYAVLAVLSIRRAREDRVNRVRAGLWLAGIGVLAIVLTLANESWLTLENLDHRGTFRSSVPWPDTKKLSIAFAIGATLVGGVFALVSRRKPPDPLPRAIVRE